MATNPAMAAMMTSPAMTAILTALKTRKMPKPEALQRIKDVEIPDFAKYRETYDLLTRAMLTWPQDNEVQAKGCWAQALAATTHAHYVTRSGGIEAVCQAMHNFPMDDRLQCEGIEALRILCSSTRDARSRALKAGALKALSMAIQTHSEAEQMQQEAIGLIAKLSQADPKGVMDNGGLENITRIMDTFPQYTWVQMYGCQAIRHLGTEDRRRVDQMECFGKCEKVLEANWDKKKECLKSDAVDHFGKEVRLSRPREI